MMLVLRKVASADKCEEQSKRRPSMWSDGRQWQQGSREQITKETETDRFERQ